VLEQRLHHLRQSQFDPLRAGDDQRSRSLGELRIEQEERQPCKVVALEMRDQDQVDIVAIDLEPVQGRQRGGPAIDQEIDLLPGDVEAGIRPATRAECIAAADKAQLHRPGLPRA
jgi:hypothetical protein